MNPDRTKIWLRSLAWVCIPVAFVIDTALGIYYGEATFFLPFIWFSIIGVTFFFGLQYVVDLVTQKHLSLKGWLRMVGLFSFAAFPFVGALWLGEYAYFLLPIAGIVLIVSVFLK